MSDGLRLQVVHDFETKTYFIKLKLKIKYFFNRITIQSIYLNLVYQQPLLDYRLKNIVYFHLIIIIC